MTHARIISISRTTSQIILQSFLTVCKNLYQWAFNRNEIRKRKAKLQKYIKWTFFTCISCLIHHDFQILNPWPSFTMFYWLILKNSFICHSPNIQVRSSSVYLMFKGFHVHISTLITQSLILAYSLIIFAISNSKICFTDHVVEKR